MTISVLMSTYYKENPQYLQESLNSLWTEQIRKPDQIVLVEDGPLTNELDAVVDHWQHQLNNKLVVVKNPENRGLAESLNAGLAVVTGDLIARMDSDDRCVPERFLLQERYMAEHPEVDILGGSIQEFNDNGSLHNVRSYPLSMADVLKTMYRVAPLAHPSVMFRKTFFDAGFRYNAKYHICEDVTMWYDAAVAHRVINNLPDTILYFRRNDSMMNRRSREKAWSEFLAYNDGIYRLYGLFTYKYIFSLLRMCFRLMPATAIKSVYNSRFRKIVARQR